MRPVHFIDTNIFLYSISRDPLEAQKQRIAAEILDRDDGALSVQVLQEFYVQTTRSTRHDALPHEIAVGLMETWTRFPIQELNLSVIRDALRIKEKHGFSYWDSAILAAAKAIGCETVYSEDMSHGRQVEGLLLVNPFV